MINNEIKAEEIVSDETKFTKICKNPMPQLKQAINKHIDIINSVAGGIKFNKLRGHYEPAYLYLNPQIHKRLSPANGPMHVDSMSAF